MIHIRVYHAIFALSGGSSWWPARLKGRQKLLGARGFELRSRLQLVAWSSIQLLRGLNQSTSQRVFKRIELPSHNSYRVIYVRLRSLLETRADLRFWHSSLSLRQRHVRIVLVSLHWRLLSLALAETKITHKTIVNSRFKGVLTSLLIVSILLSRSTVLCENRINRRKLRLNSSEVLLIPGLTF
jgi:hypothetical protein